jgi:hypothetical protein
VEQASYYPDAESGQARRIDLRPDIEAGRVTVLDAASKLTVRVMETCGRLLDIHEGEKQALSILMDVGSEYRFCTGDKAAIQALVLLDLAERATSMERMLSDAGVGRREPLNQQFGEAYLRKWLRQGAVLKAERAALLRHQVRDPSMPPEF